MDESPGTIKIVDRKDFVNIGISTHSMSLSYFVKYLEIDSSFKILFIGIEPESMDYSTKLSKKIEESANELKDIIEGII